MEQVAGSPCLPVVEVTIIIILLLLSLRQLLLLTSQADRPSLNCSHYDNQIEVDGRLVCTPKRYYMLQSIHFSTRLTKKKKKKKKSIAA